MARRPIRRVNPERLARLRAEQFGPEAEYAPGRPEHKPAKPRKRIAPQNRKRAARQRLKDFGPKADWIQSLPCSTCGRSAPCDPSHIKSRGAGGTAADLVPMCRLCHDEFHAMGRRTFASAKGCHLAALAAAYEDQWQRAVKTITPGREIPPPPVRNVTGPSGATSLDPAPNAGSQESIDIT